jgi:hypothetical protein
MIILVVMVLLGTFITRHIAHKEFGDLDMMDYLFMFINAFVLNIVGLFICIGIGYLLPKTYITEYEKPIYTLDTIIDISNDSSYLDIKVTDNSTKIIYGVESDKGVELQSVLNSDTYIKKGDYEPKVVKKCKTFTSKGYWLFALTVQKYETTFYIPEN